MPGRHFVCFLAYDVYVPVRLRLPSGSEHNGYVYTSVLLEEGLLTPDDHVTIVIDEGVRNLPRRSEEKLWQKMQKKCIELGVSCTLMDVTGHFVAEPAKVAALVREMWTVAPSKHFIWDMTMTPAGITYLIGQAIRDVQRQAPVRKVQAAWGEKRFGETSSQIHLLEMAL